MSAASGREGDATPARPEKRNLVLLVEDNPDDVILFRRALRHAAVIPSLLVAPNAEQALQHMHTRCAAEFALLIVDLNLPGMNGHELLERITQKIEWRDVPAVVLTTSDLPSDIERAFGAGAAAYIPKPRDYFEFRAVIEQLGPYWSLTAGNQHMANRTRSA